MPSTAGIALSGDQRSRRRPRAARRRPTRRCRRRAGPRPSSGERSDGARSPRRPASTATTSWREAIQAGHDRGEEGAQQPEAGDRRPGAATAPRTARTRCRTALQQRHAATRRSPMPSTHPDGRGHAAEHDRTGQDDPARLGRACRPVAAIRASAALLPARADRERRPGQQHDLEQRHHDDQRDHGEGRRRRCCAGRGPRRDLRGRRRVDRSPPARRRSRRSR